MGLLKKISSLILLLAFSFQCFNKAFIVVDYYSNTAQYAKECINKSRPKLHCNGRCAMMKKLKADEKKDQENPERKSDNKNTLTFYNNSVFAGINNRRIALLATIKKSYYLEEKCIDRSIDIFHPPQELLA